MKINFQPKKLPVPVGLIIILTITASSLFLIQRVKNLKTKTSAQAAPNQIKITNIGSYSFTVSWVTNDPATGLVEFGESSSLGQIKKDVRDQKQATSAKYYTHYVTLDNLKSETKYYFKIVSSGISYGNNQKPFEVTTANLKVPADNDIAQGKILNSNNKPASGAIVYLSISGAITQSALTDSDGNWIIPLATARTTDLKDFVNYDRNAQVEEIFVQGDLQTATATLTTNNDNPVPDITLGQTYNFIGQMPQITPTLAPTKQTFAETLPQASSSSGFSEINNQDLTIIFPGDKEEVNNPLPEFLGTGPKGQKLEIKIESNQVISSQIVPDSQGQWKYSPTTALAPGEHTITVSYTDSRGFLRKVSRSFVVLAAGTSQLPSFTATPSGQTATLTPTPTTLPTPTPTATSSALPSITPSATPTATPTVPYRTSLPSTESGTPTPGTIFPTKLLFEAGFITLLFGAALLFF